MPRFSSGISRFGRKRVAYFFVNLGNIPIMTMVNAYLSIFYTDTLGMDAVRSLRQQRLAIARRCSTERPNRVDTECVGIENRKVCVDHGHYRDVSEVHEEICHAFPSKAAYSRAEAWHPIRKALISFLGFLSLL